ncbi:hypothetical protein AgCh_001910 [Apium graveolens]
MDSYSNGFSSPRGEAFPAGLRVLVVDDDPTWLKILEKMLKKCSYEVTTCCLAREALDLLRERKDGFDIVISDVNMPDMDGFKLLEHVGLEMDLPVIMMSVDGETSRVMKGVQHGACDYLLKPIRMKELKNIWQHVFRKKIHEVRDIEGLEAGIEEFQMMRNGISDQSDDGFSFCGGDLNSARKRKDFDNKHDDKNFGDPSAGKRTRVVWTVDLHQKFVKAVNYMGFDKVGPKKILELMNVPWLTRENVASHLQKYRLYLSRLQKDNDIKASHGGIKQSTDATTRDQAGNIGFKNSINIKQNDAAITNFSFPGNVVVQSSNPKGHDFVVSSPDLGTKGALVSDAQEIQKATSSSGVGLNCNFGTPDLDAKYTTLSSVLPPQFSWNREHKPQIEQINVFNNLLPDLHDQIQINQETFFPNYPTPFNKERDKLTHIKVMPPHGTEFSSQNIRQQMPGENAFTLNPVQSECSTTTFNPSEPITRSAWKSSNDQVIDHILVNDLDSLNGNLILGKSSALTYLNVNFPACLLQEDCSPTFFELQNREFSDCNDPGLLSEPSTYLYDSLKFDYEYPCDPFEYPVMDQGLFIA